MFRLRDAAEVSVSEPVGVAFEGDDFGVDEPVDHGGGVVVAAEHFAPPNWNWLRFPIVGVHLGERLLEETGLPGPFESSQGCAGLAARR